jgi:vanillate O-demethylase monooxygenase subunit
VKCNWELINDNLLDLTHLALVHRSMIGGDAALHFNTETKVEATDRGLRTRRWMPNSDPPPAYLRAVAFKGKVDRWQEVDAWPGVMLAYTGGIDAGGGAYTGMRNGGYQIRVFNGITPETETTTHYFWSKAHNFMIDDPDVTERQFQQTATIFGEDRVVLELQQARLDEEPGRGFVDIRADHAGLTMRRLVRNLIDAEGAASKPAS